MGRLYTYLIGAVVSALLHLAVITALWVQWESPADDVFIQPNYVAAELVQLAPKAPPKQPPKASRSPADITREKRRQKEAAQRSIEKLKKEKDLARKKEREKVELAKRAAEQLRQQEADEKQRREQKAFDDLLAQEAAAQDEQDTERAANSYRQIIQKRLSENWSRPPSARRGMSAQVRIRLVPTGRVVGVLIVKSSGDPAFDQSVEQAVYKAAPFIELQAMDSRLFELKFRSVDVAFSPEDLRL